MSGKDKFSKNQQSEIKALPINVEELVSKAVDTSKHAQKVVDSIVDAESSKEEAERIKKLKALFVVYAEKVKTYNSIKPDVDPGFTEDLVQLNGGKKTYSDKAGSQKMEARMAANKIAEAVSQYLKDGKFDELNKLHGTHCKKG